MPGLRVCGESASVFADVRDIGRHGGGSAGLGRHLAAFDPLDVIERVVLLPSAAGELPHGLPRCAFEAMQSDPAGRSGRWNEDVSDVPGSGGECLGDHDVTFPRHTDNGVRWRIAGGGTWADGPHHRDGGGLERRFVGVAAAGWRRGGPGIVLGVS